MGRGGRSPETRLSPLPLTSEALAKLWSQLGSDEPHEAIWKLTTGGETSVKFLRHHLHPVAEPSPQAAPHWLAQLSNDNFAIRERAMRQLERFGEVAEPALRDYLAKKPPQESRRRIGVVLEKLEDYCQRRLSPDQVRQQRALEVLENIGPVTASQLLAELAQGARGAWLTREAMATLDRLRSR